jgi:hypothetical protein
LAAQSTVGGVLRRLGLGRRAALDPKPPVVRYQREQPGELLHIDAKKLGRIDGIGHRITGDRHGQKRGRGWQFLHVRVDDASRLASTENLPDERQASAVAFLERSLAWFASRRHGRARDDRQRLRLPQPPLPPSLRPGRPQAQADPPLHPQDQRQGRALHSDQLARMDLPAGPPDLGRAHPGHAPLALPLQSLITTHISLCL